MADRGTPSRPSTLRAYRTLMSFGFGAAPWQSALFLFFGALMAVGVPIGSLGAKLLVDAVLAQDYTGGLWRRPCWPRWRPAS